MGTNKKIKQEPARTSPGPQAECAGKGKGAGDCTDTIKRPLEAQGTVREAGPEQPRSKDRLLLGLPSSDRASSSSSNSAQRSAAEPAHARRDPGHREGGRWSARADDQAAGMPPKYERRAQTQRTESREYTLGASTPNQDLEADRPGSAIRVVVVSVVQGTGFRRITSARAARRRRPRARTEREPVAQGTRPSILSF